MALQRRQPVADHGDPGADLHADRTPSPTATPTQTRTPTPTATPTPIHRRQRQHRRRRRPPAIIYGMVFNDLNRNGAQDPGEPGMQVWVYLSRNSVLYGTTYTSADGRFQFTTLAPGLWYVGCNCRPTSKWSAARTRRPSIVTANTRLDLTLPGRADPDADADPYARPVAARQPLRRRRHADAHRDPGYDADPSPPACQARGSYLALCSAIRTATAGRTPAKAPVAGRRGLHAAHAKTQQATTGQDGRFTFDDVDPGAVAASASSAGRAWS